MDIEAQPFDLRECVESALDLVAARAAREAARSRLRVRRRRAAGGDRGDVTRLRQILLNLLSNAVKFTERGEVVLTVTRSRTDGDGRAARSPCATPASASPPTAMGRLFQSFTQADASTTRKYGGTGLGLAISKRLAELMGGEHVGRERGPGQGIHVQLHDHGADRRARPREAGATSSARSRSSRPPCPRRGRQRHQPPRPRACSGQVGHGAHADRVAGRGLALDRRGKAFDLAILDMHMPEMDGIALARGIRENNPRSCRSCCSARSGRKEAGDTDRLFDALPRQAAAPEPPVRHAGDDPRHGDRTDEPPAAPKPRIDAAMAQPPSAAHPARRGQRRSIRSSRCACSSRWAIAPISPRTASKPSNRSSGRRTTWC